MTDVLYLSYDGMTDQLGQSQVIPYLEGLTKKGYRFHLVSFEKKASFEKTGDLISAALQVAGIKWYPYQYTKKPPVLSTVRDLMRMQRNAMRIIKENNVKLIHCRSYISGLAGLYLKNKTELPFIFDIRGFWADERVDGELWDLHNLFYKFIYNFFKKKEKQMLIAADAIISLTENARNELNSWQLKKDNLPVTVIPCCADMNLFNPSKIVEAEKEQLRKHLLIASDAPVITYLGAIGTWYMLEEMLAFFSLLKTKIPALIFLFITNEHPDAIIKVAEKMNIDLSSLRFYKAAREQVPLALSLGSTSLFLIKPAYSKKASSPTKQAEIMAMGIPVICNRGIGDTDSIVTNYRSGYLVDVNDHSTYLEAVDNFNYIHSLNSASIISGAHEFYSLESGVAKYHTVYKTVLGFSDDDKVHDE
jgi:glycosyltransferase involved in cell wall biosynthesis